MIDPVKLSQQNLAAARAVKLEDEQAHEAAVLFAAGLRDRLSEGDRAVTSDDLVSADAGVERCALLAAASARAVQRAARAVVNVDLSLAECLVPVLSGLTGIAVHAVAARPTDVADVPALYVVQVAKATADPYRGHLAGSLEVIFHRGAIHRELTTDAVEQAAGRAGVALTAHPRGSRSEGAAVVDTMALTVAVAYPAEPVLADVQPFQVAYFGQALAGALQGSFQHRGWGAETVGIKGPGSGDASRLATTVKVTATSATITGTPTVDATGKRRTVVSIGLKAMPGRGCEIGDFEQMTQAVRGQLARQVDTPIEGLGRVTSLEVLDVAPGQVHSSRKSTGCQLTARVALVSRTVAAKVAA